MSEAIAFSPAADPNAYLPWTASERALQGLLRWALESNRSVCLLAGPPGLGKTLLLKVLAARVGDRFRSVFLAYPECEPKALAAFLLEAIGREASGDADAELLAALSDLAADGRGLLLLIDEGELLPEATARWLLGVAERSGAALRIAIAVTRDECHADLAALFAAACQTERLEGAMSRAEVGRHVQSGLARAGVEPALCAHFDDATLDELHARSEGVPVVLQNLASALLFEALRAQHMTLPVARTLRAANPKPAPLRVDPERTADPDGFPARGVFRPAFALGIAIGLLAGLAGTLVVQRVRSTDRNGVAGPVQVPSDPLQQGPNENLEAEDIHYATAASSLRDVAAPPPPAEPAPATEPSTAPQAEAAPSAPIAEPVPATQPSTVARAQPAPGAPTVPPAAPEPATPEPAKANVAVSLNAEPWARVEIDGIEVGETPIAEMPIAPGRHRFRALLPDGRVIVREIVINESNRRVVFR